MLKNLLILTLVVFGISTINISAQTVNEAKTISKGVVNGSAVSFPKPAYPAAAKALRASGAVSVEVLIDETGNVISANAVSGHPLLRQASVQAARGAKFKPTMLDGEAVKVKGVIVYNFVLPKEDDDSEETGNVPVTGMTGKEIEDSGEIAASKGTILNGSATNLVKPVYPVAAKAVKASGAVNVEVIIDEDGNVEKAVAVSGHPLLRLAAVDAAAQSKFKPTLIDGQPAKVSGIIVFNFVP